MDSARSAQPGRFWKNRTTEEVYRLFVPVVEKQNADIERLGVPCLRVQFADMMTDTRRIVLDLSRFCGLSPQATVIENAVAFVSPNLNHHTKV